MNRKSEVGNQKSEDSGFDSGAPREYDTDVVGEVSRRGIRLL
jgi:hypothetical protein